MKKILIIGIGAGDPDYVTMQAVNALNQADVFFMMDKGPSKAKLIELRKEICRRYIRGDGHRFVDATSPQWTRGTEDYFSTVDDLNRDKQALFERLISQELADGECGAFLVWGDPSVYDSMLRIIERVLATGVTEFEYTVIPGVTSVQALAAAQMGQWFSISRNEPSRWCCTSAMKPSSLRIEVRAPRRAWRGARARMRER